MAILSNELLFNIEMNLSKALMSKRIDAKEATPPGKGTRFQAAEGRKGKEHGTAAASKAKGVHEEMGQEETEIMIVKLIQVWFITRDHQGSLAGKTRLHSTCLRTYIPYLHTYNTSIHP